MKRHKNTAKAGKKGRKSGREQRTKRKKVKLTAKTVEKPYQWDYAMFEAIAEGYNL